MSTQRFVDALSGADGTRAPTVRYDVPPVYPDATVPIAPVRPTAVPLTTVRIPEIDPRIAAAVSETAAVDRMTADRVPRAPRSDQRPPRPPQAPPPSRSQAARAGYYQGPTPTAIAPAAAARHQQAPARPRFPSVPSAPAGPTPAPGDRLRAQLAELGRQFGTGNVRTPAAQPSSPQAGRRSAEPATAFQPPAPRQRTAPSRTNTIQISLFVLLFVLLVTGLGAQIVDAVAELLQR